TPPDPGDSAMLFEAIRLALVHAATDGPVTVFLDDLQWADHGTLDLLPPLARSVEREPVAIVAAYRSDDIPRGHPLRRMRANLRRARRLRELVVNRSTSPRRRGCSPPRWTRSRPRRSPPRSSTAPTDS